MKKFYILLFVNIFVIIAMTAKAQQDTISVPTNLLLKNVISDDSYFNDESDNSENQTKIVRKQNDNKNDNEEIIDDNGRRLRLIEMLYNAGKYNDALKVSNQFDEHELTNKELLHCKKYKIATLKEMEYNEQADSLTQSFQAKFPFYEIQQYDPLPFQELMDNYYTMPKFYVWISGGSTVPQVLIDTVYATNDTASVMPKYKGETGFKFELGVSYHISRYFAIAAAVNYSNVSFNREANILHGALFTYSEKTSFVSIPVMLTVSKPGKRNKWIPELSVGVESKSIINSKYIAYTQRGQESKYATDYIDADIIEKNKTTLAILGSFRLNYNYKRVSFFVDNTLSYSFDPINNSKYKTYNSDLVYNNMYVPDSFRLLILSACMGVKFNLHYATIAKYKQ